MLLDAQTFSCSCAVHEPPRSDALYRLLKGEIDSTTSDLVAEQKG